MVFSVAPSLISIFVLAPKLPVRLMANVPSSIIVVVPAPKLLSAVNDNVPAPVLVKLPAPLTVEVIWVIFSASLVLIGVVISC